MLLKNLIDYHCFVVFIKNNLKTAIKCELYSNFFLQVH